MNAYANVHLALEKMRVRALSAQRGSPLPAGADQEVDSEPPRVLVLGPENSGKTTVCKILANYAVRAGQGWTPMFVNAAPSQVGVFFFVFFFFMCIFFGGFFSWVLYAGRLWFLCREDGPSRAPSRPWR